MSNNIIDELINDGKWNQIYELIKNKKMCVMTTQYNTMCLFHYLCLMNKKKIIKYIINNDNKIIELKNVINKDNVDINNNVINDFLLFDGDTCLHIFSKLKYFNILLFCINKYPKYVNTLNKFGESILHFITNNKILEYLIKKIKNINTNFVSNNNTTPLLINILKTKNDNDEYYKNILLIINNFHNKNEIDIPINNSPLCFSCKLNKSHVIKYILNNKYNPNVNIYDIFLYTPLLYSYFHNNIEIFELLLNNNANANDCYNYGNISLLSKSIIDNKNKITELLLKNKSDINQYDNKLNTSAHYLFSKKNVSQNLLFYFIENTDLNIQNIKGNTPLHFLLKNYDWKNFCVILKQKKLDIYIKNIHNKTPLNYIPLNELNEFIKLIAESYINLINKNNTCDICNCINANKNNITKCIPNVMQLISQTYQSYPTNKKSNENFYLMKGREGLASRFWSSICYETIYTAYILKKYNNVCVPQKQYDKDDHLKITKNISSDNKKSLIKDKIKILLYNYYKYSYEIIPYVIMWANKNDYFIDDNIMIYIQKGLENEKITYIFMMATILLVNETENNIDLHANLIIFDKKTGIFERFNPTKNLETTHYNELDNFLLFKFKNGFEKYLKKYNIAFSYINNHYYNNYKYIGYQYLSIEQDINTKQQGEIDGYCLAWSFWYLETRINNPDVHPTNIINLFAKKIIQLYGHPNIDEDITYIFINYIREYANKLDYKKNIFMINSGIKDGHLYDTNIQNNDANKIINKLRLDFSEILLLKNLN